MQLARDRLDVFATRDSGLMLMRWICRRAGSKEAAQACVEFGDADRASILWGAETKEMKRRPGDDEKTHVSFVRYACTTASNDEVASGRWDAAIEFEARACNAGADMACDAMLELEVTRDARVRRGAEQREVYVGGQPLHRDALHVQEEDLYAGVRRAACGQAGPAR
jgi:hypothetical protein